MSQSLAATNLDRKLAAIMSCDVAGYGRLIGRDEESTVRTLARYREIMAELMTEHRCRIFNTAGDSVLAECASPVQTVRCAVAIQRALRRRNADLPAHRQMHFRIGINLGDVVVVENGDLLGDAVNLAARLQEIATADGINVAASVHDHLQGKIDCPTRDLGPQLLKNMPRPVRIFSVDWESDSVLDGSPTGHSDTPRLPTKPSIAVLPFVNLSMDTEQDYFADGITEDIVTGLSKYRWFFVIARNSSFQFKGADIDVRQVARQLGVRFVLRGTVRKSGSNVRIGGQLIDAPTGGVIWAQNYDGTIADVFALQDQITHSVIGAIEPEMIRTEISRVVQAPVQDLDAWDVYLRGLWHYHRVTQDGHLKAREIFREAIAKDATLSPAYVGLTRTIAGILFYGWSKNRAEDVAEGFRAATRATELDDADPYCHYAMSLMFIGTDQHERAVMSAQRSIDLSPSFALGYWSLGLARLAAGRAEQAIDPLLRAQRLSPQDPISFTWAHVLSLSYYIVGRFADAEAAAEAALRIKPNFIWAHRNIVACRARQGRTTEANSALRDMERLLPAGMDLFADMLVCHARPSDVELIRDGLRLAGWSPDAKTII
jgi:adenylate cyclase